jgi:hypothetical protein
MSYTIESVTLPTGPERVSKRLPAKVEEFEVDAALPILIVPNLRGVEVNIEGFLVGDKASIETTYLQPLEAFVGKEVTVSFPDSRYDGDWVLADFQYEEVNAKKFTYSIKLQKGSSHIIFSGA